MKYEVTIKNISNSDIKITTETKSEMVWILSSLSLYTYLGYNRLLKEKRDCLSKEAKEISDAFQKASIKASKEF